MAARSAENGGIVLPMLFLGPDRSKTINGQEFFGMDMHGSRKDPPQQLGGSAYWVDNELFVQLLRAVLKQLRRAGFRIVVAHGHGPSTGAFSAHVDEWSQEFGLRLFICWRDDESDGLGIQTDHAAANETSLMMALHPELVQMENLPRDPATWPVAVSGDDPRTHASPELGRKAIDLQAERMAALLTQALSDLNSSA